MESTQTNPNTVQQVTQAGQDAINAWMRHNQRGVSRDKGIRPAGFASRSDGAKQESTAAADEHYHTIVENQLAQFAGSKTALLPHSHILKKVLRHHLGLGVYPWSTVGYTEGDLKLMLGGDPEATARYWISEVTDHIGFVALLEPFSTTETEVSDDPSPEQVAEAVERLQRAG